MSKITTAWLLFSGALRLGSRDGEASVGVVRPAAALLRMEVPLEKLASQGVARAVRGLRTKREKRERERGGVR